MPKEKVKEKYSKHLWFGWVLESVSNIPCMLKLKKFKKSNIKEAKEDYFFHLGQITTCLSTTQPSLYTL